MKQLTLQKQLNKLRVKKWTKIKRNNWTNCEGKNLICRKLDLYIPHLKSYLNNIPTPSLNTPHRKSITWNRMAGMEQPDQILLPATEIWGYVSIANPLRPGTANQTDPLFNQQFSTSSKRPERYTVIESTLPLGVWIMILTFPYSGRILITARGWTHRDPSRPQSQSLADRTTVTSSTRSEGRRIWPKVYSRGIAQWKVKGKTLEATFFSKVLSPKIILSWNSWAQYSVNWNQTD